LNVRVLNILESLYEKKMARSKPKEFDARSSISYIILVGQYAAKISKLHGELLAFTIRSMIFSMRPVRNRENTDQFVKRTRATSTDNRWGVDSYMMAKIELPNSQN